MKRLLAIITLCMLTALSAGFALISFTEGRLPIFEYADTRFAPNFSFESIASIAIGDSKQSIFEKLGVPLWKLGCDGCWEPRKECHTAPDGFHGCIEYHEPINCDEKCTAPEQQWQYTDDGNSRVWDFAWREYTLVFKGDKLTQIIDAWRYD